MKFEIAKTLFESFIFGCCETAARTFFVLPKEANIFKKIGKEAICGVIANKTAEAVTDEIGEICGNVKEIKKVVKITFAEEKEQNDED